MLRVPGEPSGWHSQDLLIASSRNQIRCAACRRKRKQVTAASALFLFGLRRVHPSKEASGLGRRFKNWSGPVKLHWKHWIIDTMVEAVISGARNRPAHC